MEIILIGLIGVITILFLYIYRLKREIKRAAIELKKTRNESSNALLNKQMSEKNISVLVKEINEMLKTINVRKIELNIKSEELKKMIINISHDLKTPLTSALGYIDLIRNSQLSKEEKDKYIIIIEERLNKLSKLISSFFDFSKILSSNEKVEMKEENMIKILEDCIVHFYDDFNNEGRKINLNSKIAKFNFLGNKMMLTRIFDNLINNAYQHSTSDLIIEVHKNKDNIEFIFMNTLEDKTLNMDSMFDEFYTSDISRTKGNTGLGLAIVKQFVESLNGQVYAIQQNNTIKVIVTLTER